MISKEQNFHDLYEEYKKLKLATHLEAQVLKPGQPYKVYPINPRDLLRRKDVAEELIANYKEYFKDKPDEWWDLISGK
jgi:hypothetical protein